MRKLLTAFASFIWATQSLGVDLRIAAASNLGPALQQLIVQFEQRHALEVSLSLASTGQLTNQIQFGAPFDLFFSADEQRMQVLQDKGLLNNDTRQVIVQGRLALWSAQPVLLQGGYQAELWATFSNRRLAIAEPKLAPYGLAAQQVLQQEGAWELLRPRLVYGQSAAQAFQFAYSRNADLALIPLSEVWRNNRLTEGSLIIIPEHLHSAIIQEVAVLKRSQQQTLARQFLDFLNEQSSQQIFVAFGYKVLTTAQGD